MKLTSDNAVQIKAAKIFSLIPCYAFGIMILDFFLQWIGTLLFSHNQSDFSVILGITLAMLFLVLCMIVPPLEIICGIVGLILSRKAVSGESDHQVRKWYILSIIDIIIGILLAVPCIFCLMVAMSGQI